MTRARDLADSADKDIAGTLAVDGLDISVAAGGSSEMLFSDNVSGRAKILYDHGASPNEEMGFEIAGSRYMTIENGGNVGIGTASPSRTLTVNSGTTNTAFRLEGTDAEVAMQFYDGTKTSTIQGGTSGLSFYPNTTVDKALAITSTGKVETTNRDFGFFNHGTNVSLADDASIVINASVAGCGVLAIYETASGTNALYRVGYGSTAVLSGSGAVTMTTSDTDGAVCVFSSGHTITIKNRVGATKGFTIAMFMAGNTFAG